MEMVQKNFEKDWKSFGTVLKIWQKNTCGRAEILETLHAAIIFQRFPDQVVSDLEKIFEK